MKSTNNLEFFHFQCLQGMYFSKILKTANYLILSSELIEDNYYNYCAGMKFNDSEFKEQWNNIKKQFPQNRVPAIYVSPMSDLYCTQRKYLSDFSKAYTDAWMVLEDESCLNQYVIPANISLVKVSNEEEFNEFVETFKSAYGSDDPNDPYGNLSPTYTEALESSFRKGSLYVRHHYIAYMDGIAAGVASAICKDDLVGIYNVGTISKFRKKGVGQSLMSYIFGDVVKNKTMFLQTEKGTAVESWYVKQGFQTLFVGECYCENR
ncbi:MAG: GNAT family N-acetyltransferase [Lachnospiraceae bacterium]|nr:GNAT family N-acetyltransferase [Lachnospiraceae bacterium]